jgi:hypothetical protein
MSVSASRRKIVLEYEPELLYFRARWEFAYVLSLFLALPFLVYGPGGRPRRVGVPSASNARPVVGSLPYRGGGAHLWLSLTTAGTSPAATAIAHAAGTSRT